MIIFSAPTLDDWSITSYLPLMAEQKKSDLTRQKILTSGRALISKHGFGAVGLARILKESGVPKGSFYYYFPSKEAFGHALLTDYVADYLARIDALCATQGSAHDKLTAFWTAWLTQAGSEGIASQCLVVKLGAEVADLSEDMRQVLDKGVTALVNRIAALLILGAKDGSLIAVDDPQATAQMLYAKWLGAAILAKLSRNEIPLRQALSETNKTLSKS
ncbi:TetR/AcrR family transcriptional regulator [Sulfitobacter sp. HGT1]|mgnify:FL=1|jgi:TetR/AcrR family transcriptional repressor of nem operon|uniref:TetR/AcrR family transcriptional regulator n=1 Tax=unclassified Sulfitobacter TaxID=196795 RepID=UPI00280AAA45|nr:TetR/AcrR family transcriptional regulator [Sulfitobacter sp. HGT1]